MATKKQKLTRAVEQLARVNGLYTMKNLTANLPLPVGGSAPTSTSDLRSPETLEALVMDLLVNTSDGALQVDDLFTSLKSVLEEGEGSEDLQTKLNQTVEIYFTKQKQVDLFGDKYNEVGDILGMLGYGDGGAGATSINQLLNNPNKGNPTLSLMLSNNIRVSPTGRDTNPTTIFMNAIPNVELARATPFLDVTLFIPRSPKNAQTKQIQTLSLPKFLLGAQQVESDTPLDSILNANTEQRIFTHQGGTAGNYEVGSELRDWTTAGMELFTAPQTLVNADLQNGSGLHATEVLDPFKPLMTIKSVNISVTPTTGIMSYKTAQMELVLHDRSRLSEAADFIRADLYSTNELQMEYGWMHPDGESLVNDENSSERNPYGDLINGMRTVEKYKVINSSFSMTPSGEVNISLSLAMNGGTDFEIELAGSDSEGVASSIREIIELQKSIAELRHRALPANQGAQTREIRGVQILNAASDALNHINFSSDLREALKDFRQQMRGDGNPSMTRLLRAMDGLFGTEDSSGTSNNGAGRRLTRNMVAAVATKMAKMKSTPDPMAFIPPSLSRRNRQRRNPQQPRSQRDRTRVSSSSGLYTPNNGFASGTTSLSKLLLLFIGEPLANSGNFDDVQLIFYPFNSYAGLASRINIGNFLVDNAFFAENFVRWRLSRIGRSTNANLREFMGFIVSTLLDDPAAVSYGLYEGATSLYRTTVTENGTTLGLEQVNNPASHMHKVNEILKDITPDGSFKIPTVEFYVESLPRKFISRDSEDSTNVTDSTILRLHIYDKKASSVDTLGSLLASSRDSELASIGQIAPEPETSEEGNPTPGVSESRLAIHNEYLSRAEDAGLIAATDRTSNNDTGTYRITGGPNAIKDFLYSTMPYMIYGTIGTTILSANLSSMQDPALSTINIMSSARRTGMEPNGENPGGLPMKIIPSELSITTVGCPFFNIAQEYFVDFKTGTTADNIYGVVSVSHKLSPGSFTTDVSLTPLDSYGKYESLLTRLSASYAVAHEINEESNTE